MLELTGIGSVLRGIGVLYWLLAIGALGFALWKGKNWRHKTLWAVAVVAVFGYLPAKEIVQQTKRDAYAREAWAYFKKMCDERSGEKIYKTYAGVKSVLIVKPLPPATDKDHFDQFWYGDPYSLPATSNRAVRAAGLLTLDSSRPSGVQKGLEFVEIRHEANNGVQYQRISSPPGRSDYTVENIQKPLSRFGVMWDDISTPDDRKYWVAGSRLRVIDFTDNAIVAERIGYFIEAGFGSKVGQRRPWLTSRGPNTTCPPLVGGDYSDNWFVTSVFKQNEEK